MSHIAFYICFSILFWGHTAHSEETSDLRLPSLTVGFSATTMIDVAPADARAASQIWLEKVLKSLNDGKSGAEAQVVVYQTQEEIEMSLLSKTVDIVLLTPAEYLQMASHISMIPVMHSIDYADNQYTFGLYVHKNANIDHISQLKDKTINLQVNTLSDLQLLWLDTLLLEHNLPLAEATFKSKRQFKKTSQAVLPVFFQQVDVCLVPVPRFEVLAQFNPQIKKDLKRIAQSPSYSRALICARPEYNAQYQDLLEEAIKDLNNTPHGRQLRLLFKIDKNLIPFEPHQLDNARALIKKHRALTSENAQ